MNIPVDWVAAGPSTLAIAGALVGLMVDAFAPRRTWLGSAVPTVVGVAAGGLELLRTGSIDDIAFGFSLIVVVGTLLGVAPSTMIYVTVGAAAGGRTGAAGVLVRARRHHGRTE